MYLLDTNICIYLIKQRPSKVLERLMRCSPEEVALSVITVSELAYGARKSQAPERNRSALELFAAPFQILPFTEDAAYVYGDVRATLEKKGTPIGSMDLMIASHALAVGAVLVSNNLREFRRVPELTMENWVH
jgi:tRNA(fMet)-specific endonuclease VapC